MKSNIFKALLVVAAMGTGSSYGKKTITRDASRPHASGSHHALMALVQRDGAEHRAMPTEEMEYRSCCTNNNCSPCGTSIRQLLCEVLDRLPCNDTFEITQDDFKNGTLEIDKPGCYKLCEDINYTPTEPGDDAIFISASNVELDLNCHTLRQANDTPECAGIYIAPDAALNNVTVKNGSLVNWTALGLLVSNDTWGETGVTFDNLTFSDLSILNCGTDPSSFFVSGLELRITDKFPQETDPAAYRNVTIENCAINNNIGEGALMIQLGDNVRIQNSQFNNLEYTKTTLGYGIFSVKLSACRNVMMADCQANNLNVDTETLINCQAGPILAELGANLLFQNCQFNNAYAPTATILNSNLSLNDNMVCENCQFNSLRGADNPFALPYISFVAGVHCSDNVGSVRPGNGNVYRNCQFNGIQGGYSTTGFISVTVRDLTFEGCESLNVSGPGLTTAGFFVGVSLDDVPAEVGNLMNLTFRNCIAANIAGTWDSLGIASFAWGLNLISGTTGQLVNTVVENCIAERISNDANSRGVTSGIASFTDRPDSSQVAQISNLFVRNCRVSDVRSANEESTESAGIYVKSVERPVLCDNSVSDCDRGILFTGSNSISPNAFQVAETEEQALAGDFIPLQISIPLPDCLTLGSVPGPSAIGFGQYFDNVTNGTDTIGTTTFLQVPTKKIGDDPYAGTSSMFFSGVNLNALDWHTGDQLTFHNDGCDDGFLPLVDGETYYAIVYRLGYSVNGLVQNNKVDNCSVAGYEDRRLNDQDVPETASAWLSNVAFNNGTPSLHADNYAIGWAGVPPVNEGDLANYPTGSEKAYNTSLIPA